MAVMDIQVAPRREGSISVSDAVVAAHRVIEEAGLPHVLHPMGTCIEGEPSQLYELAGRIHAALADMGYPRIGVTIKVDDRRDQKHGMLDKIKVVEQKLRAERPE
jgi:uncharacterized protein (TIGR00106 family)